MAKIPESELEALKRDISIRRLVESRGVRLRGRGDNLMGLCPFHDDKEPSLVVSPQKNVWHCLGACKTGGSVIDWVMKSEGVSFRLAVEMLRTQTPSLVAKTPLTAPKLERVFETDVSDAVVLSRVVSFYHATLKESAEGLAYLEKRGLVHPELIGHFRLGYSNRTLGYRLPQKNRQAGAVLRGQLERIGIYRESGHEHLSGSLVIPVFGERGPSEGAEVLEVYGRKVRDDLRKGTPLHLYLPRRPDGRRGVFNHQAFWASKEIILCESLIDALTFWCAGFRNVTAAYGVEGFTKEHVQALIAHKTERVLLAYDRDDAGNRAAEALGPELAKLGLSVFRVTFPKGMDPNSYALAVKPKEKSLDLALRGATWMAGHRPVSVSENIEPPSVSAEAAADEPEAAFNPETGEVLAAPSVAPSLVAPAVVAPSVGPSALTEISRSEHEVRFGIEDRSWRVRGLSKNTSYESLKVTLFVAHRERFFVDTVELYVARQRQLFVKQAAIELGLEERIVASDVGKLVLGLEDMVHEHLTETLAVPKTVTMSPEEQAEALGLLKDPRLLSRILEDFEKAGVVGEESNKLVGYLAAVSRKLESPLAVVIQSSSAAGKSSLMEAILRFVPDEARIQYSAMTGQSLFYMGEHDLSHKVLAIAEEEGATQASYALKLLQSEGALSIASTGKDPASGRLTTHEYTVSGPVAIFLTTTAVEVDEELLNRCLVLGVDEGQGQTEAIFERQRQAETLEGLLTKKRRDKVIALHQNAQRLLESLSVVNPLAEGLRFSGLRTRSRRDHAKYLTLIRAIALLHQHQREVKTVDHEGAVIRYVEVEDSDIEVADRLMAEVLGPSRQDLPPQTERLLKVLEAYVSREAERQKLSPSEVRFSRRDVRTWTGWGSSSLKKHMMRLEEMELVDVKSTGVGRKKAYGLAEATTLDLSPLGAHWSPPKALWTPPGHGVVTPGARPLSPNDSASQDELVTVSAKTRTGRSVSASSQSHPSRSLIPKSAKNGRVSA